MESRFEVPPAGPYRFAVFGDQRALADGEWQALVAEIARVDAAGPPVEFVIDTGDIVQDGSHSDQFAFLAGILSPISHVPYLVGVGNHELHNNRTPAARDHAASFLSYLDGAGFGRDRLHYRKQLGAGTFLFLDTNDFVYGRDGGRAEVPATIDPASPEGRQMEWLERELAKVRDDELVVAVMHHPIVQSSKKHLAASRSLWNAKWKGRHIVDLLADAGVDVILTGHTHTYEHFRLVRDDGPEIDLINLSGRPRPAFLFFGAGSRRARDLGGDATDWLVEQGWEGMERWTVVQESAMLERETNQFALFTLHPDGALDAEVRFLDSEAPGGVRSESVSGLH